MCSWNIKNFGTLKKRTAESLYYIAEIINAFDIVALQEINRELGDFKKVLKLLGSHWKHTFTDVTEGSAGNDERFGFIYDSRDRKSTRLNSSHVRISYAVVCLK